MSEEIVGNNQDDSVVEPEVEVTPTEGVEAEVDEGATEETDDDVIKMRSDYTQKTQALAEERKKWEEEREKFMTEHQKKLELFERMDKDPRVVEAVRKIWGQAEQSPQYSEDELYEAQTNPQKFQELIDKEIQKRMSPITSSIGKLQFERDLTTYASQSGNEDFWDLDKTGLIQAQLQLLKQQNPNLGNKQLIERAHSESRRLVNSIADTIKKQEETRINAQVQKKKASSIDKGGKSSVPTIDNVEGKSLVDVGMALLKNRKP